MPRVLTWRFERTLETGLIWPVLVAQTLLRWTSIGPELEGKRLGVLGQGDIGGAVVRIGFAFGMKVIAWRPRKAAVRSIRRDGPASYSIAIDWRV